MRHSPFSLWVLVCFICGVSGQNMADEMPASLVVGAVQDEYVFSCGCKGSQGVTPSAGGFIVLQRSRIDGKGKVVAHELPVMVASADSKPVFLRWRIDQKAFWGISFWPITSGDATKYGGLMRLPPAKLGAFAPHFAAPAMDSHALQSIAFLEPLARAYEDAAEAHRKPKLPARLLGSEFDDEIQEMADDAVKRKRSELELCVKHGKAACRQLLAPLLKVCDAFETVSRDLPYPHYDFLAGPGNACTLFIRNGRSMSRWEHGDDLSKTGVANRTGWSRQESWKVNWSEPFHVHENGSTYFFVTDSGRLFAGRKAAKGGDGTVKELQVGRQPLVALLFDPAGKRAFAFGKNFVLELKEGAQPSRCQDVTAKESQRDQAMRTLVNCAKILGR